MLITDYAVRRRTAVFVFLFLLVIAGAFSYVRLPREGAPDLTIPYVFVTAVYQGMAPEEMEHLVTIPLERQLKDLDHVKNMLSTSAEGISRITIEFTDREDMDSALRNVKDKIDMAQPDLPADLDEPLAQSINFSTDFPILMLAVSGDTDLQRLKFIAHDLRDGIETISGVREVELIGSLEREVRIEFDPSRLLHYRLTPTAIARRIQQENRTISAGRLELEGSTIQVRIPGEFDMPFEFETLAVASRDGHPVYLTDVAAVSDTFKDVDSISRINGKPCISMQIKKRSGVNTVRIVDRIEEVIGAYEYPPGIGAEITMDQAHYIRLMVSELENNIISGFFLVIIVLLLFLGLRNALLVALAIPISMLLTFTLMRMLEVTLNMIVLFSLVIAVGMLVDNAIVIIENIFRLHSEGVPRAEASRIGGSQVAWPIITSTLTTLAAFSPLLLWPGLVGEFMGFLPRTLIVVLLASLFVALVINPAVCSVFIRPASRQKIDRADFFLRFADRYERFLRAALRNRAMILVFGFLVLVLSALLFERFGGEQEFFPDIEPSSATISIQFPEGAPLEKTDAVLSAIEAAVMPYPDLKYTLSTAGMIGGRGFGGGAGPHLGAVHVEFVDIAERKRDSFEIIDEIRARIGNIPGAMVVIDRERAGPPSDTPIAIEISGDDFRELARLSDRIMRRIRGTPGLVDVRDDFELARPEIRFHVDRQRAALFGLDADQIGQYIRTSLFGMEASKWRAGEDQFDITLRLPLETRDTTDLLQRLFVPTVDGRNIPLSSLGSLEYVAGRGAIQRRDGRRVVTIRADTSGGRTPQSIIEEIQPLISEVDLPGGYDVIFRGDYEDMQEASAFLAGSFLMALGLIAVILVIQFNSVVYPFIIMFSVIMSMAGVLLGLLICRMNFVVVMTGVGIISLAGVVVNNSIVLVDCILQHHRGGLPFQEAIIAGGKQRLRPVLLTAVTTILALLPMALGVSINFHTWPFTLMTDAETTAFWAPMAIAVIFGLGLASLLTLVQVPVMCSVAESLASACRRYSPAAGNGDGK